MAKRSPLLIRNLFGALAVLFLVLVLALPAQASEYDPSGKSLRATPTIEINPDEHHHDHSNLDGSVPMGIQELAISTCSGGFAGEYPCQGIDFMSRVPLTSFPGSPLSASNLWGYVDLDDNREYAVIGLRNGTGVVDVTDPANPVIVGHIGGVSSQWREVKVYQFWNDAAGRWDAYAYVTTEGSNGGIQIIDLTQLPASVSLAATWTGVATSHTDQISNIDFTNNVANDPNFPPVLYISGSNKGGLRFVSLANPTSLAEVGFWTGTYSHDTYPHVFSGTRADQCAPGHNPCEVVFSFAGTAGLKIIDVTDKSAPVTLSTFIYPQLGYTHSGWISADGNYIFLHDELDEQNFGINGTIRTIDISNLRAPFLSNSYVGPTLAIDHNGYTIGNKFYYSNYTRGIAILDVTNPNAPVQTGFFDSYPATNGATFNGAWGVYPFLPSGNILISDIQRGLIVVREQAGAGPSPTPTVTNTPGITNTPTFTPTATNTPTPTNTPGTGNTGWLSPSLNAAQTSGSGDNNGYELNPASAHADGGGFAQDVNSGSNNNGSCTANSKDRHRYYNFNVSLPGGAAVRGIEVRLDALVDAVGSNSPKICVQLSWDGGTTWTTAKQTATLTTAEASYVLGGPADTWGRAWTLANLSNTSFRIRVVDTASSSNATSRDFSLDWIALRVTYQ
jgi:choice-of-anchor B domain-containing protein